VTMAFLLFAVLGILLLREIFIRLLSGPRR
jgi:hypothetical protein